MLTRIVAQMGASDCEAIGGGIFVQPVNTASSLSYVVVGVMVGVWGLTAEPTRRASRVTFGALLAATGFGSVLFHGPQYALSQMTHDATFLVALWFLVVANLADGLVPSVGRRWAVFGLGAAAIVLLLVAVPGVTNAVMVVTVILLVASDVAARRAGRRSSGWYVASFVAAALAVLLFGIGRTGSPYCDPGSLFQGHALWHALSAVALGAYFVATSRQEA